MIILYTCLHLMIFISVGLPTDFPCGYGFDWTTCAPQCIIYNYHSVFFQRSFRLCDRSHWLRLGLLVISRHLERTKFYSFLILLNFSNEWKLFDALRLIRFSLFNTLLLVCGIPNLSFVCTLFVNRFFGLLYVDLLIAYWYLQLHILSAFVSNLFQMAGSEMRTPIHLSLFDPKNQFSLNPF